MESLEPSCWAAFAACCLYQRKFYWNVVFIAALGDRLLYLILGDLGNTIASEPSIPLIAVLEICWVTLWACWFGLTIYCLFLSPINAFVSPIDLILKHSEHKRFVQIQEIQQNDLKTSKSGAKVDLFAIHGLGSDPEKSWLHREKKIDWLESLLPLEKKMPGMRIFKVNHRSHWDANASTMSFEEHAKTMLEAIEANRSNQDTPVIFVAHSFGGLFLKKVLMLARGNGSSFSRCVGGILFFGTPHNGASMAFPAAILSCLLYWRDSTSELLNYMSPKGEKRRILQDEFHRSFVYKEMGEHIPYICDFYEEFNDPLLFGISLGQLVSREPGTIGHGDFTTLGTTHRGLNKFYGAEDENYQKVLKRLQKAYDRAMGFVNKRVLMIPDLPNTEFVGRKAEMSLLMDLFSAPSHTRIAIYGLGGIGKTTLANHFIHEYARKNVETSVFWVHAGTYTNFIASYQRIAEKLKIPGRDVPGTDILRLVHDWLSDSDKRRYWLMVIDNADDTRVFEKIRSLETPSGEDLKLLSSLKDYISNSPFGKILMTTRSQKAATQILGPCYTPIDLTRISIEEGISLLRNLSQDTRSSDEDARLLTERLECLPLALTQAGSFILQSEAQSNITKYLHQFDNPRYRDSLLRMRAGLPDSVSTVWFISFEQIKTQNRQAADILCHMAYLNPQNIQTCLLDEDPRSPEFDEAISTLLAFSFITRLSDSECFSIHSLVQVSTKYWIENDAVLNAQLPASVIHSILNNVPESHWDLSEWDSLLPHIDQILQHTSRSSLPLELKELISLLRKSTYHLKIRGRLDIAENYARRDIALCNIAHGEDPANEQTLHAFRVLCLILSDAGARSEAMQICQDKIGVAQQKLGHTHDITLELVFAKVWILYTQGSYKAAQQLCEDAIIKLQTLEIQDRESLLKFQFQKAQCLVSLLDYPSASHILEELLKLQGNDETLYMRKLFLFSRSILATCFQKMNKIEQAILLLRETLALQEQMFSQAHQSALQTKSMLADAIGSQGDLDSAIKMMLEVIDTANRFYTKDVPWISDLYNVLAHLYAKQGKLGHASIARTLVFHQRLRSFGENHPGTLQSQNNLANSYQLLGHNEEALWLLKSAETKASSVLGTDHTNTLFYRRNHDRLLKKLESQKSNRESGSEASNSGQE